MSAVDDVCFEEGYDETFFSLASSCAEPFWWTYGIFCRFISPADPNKFDNQASRIGEIAVRTLIAVGTIITAVTATTILGLVVVIPFTTACLIFRAIGVALQKNQFTYLKGGCPEKTLEDMQIGIMEWSIGGFRAGEHYIEGLTSWRARVDEMVQLMQKENPEVLILLDVQDTALVDELIKQLGPHYAHIFTQMGADQWGGGAHMMVFSRCRVNLFEHSCFYHFGKPLHSGFDLLEIKASPEDPLPSLRILGVGANLRDQPSKEARVEQMEQVIARLAEKQLAIPTFFVGRFNVDNPRQKAFLTKYLYHSYRDGQPTATGELASQWDPNQPTETGIVDFVSLFKRSLPNGTPLPTQEKGVRLLDCHLVKAFDDHYDTQQALSNHHGLFARFQIGFKEQVEE